jgi:hypothetical protein
MKVTKSQLKEIIKEEIMKEFGGSFGTGGGLTAQLAAVRPEKDESFHDLGPDVQRLYAEWNPETDEGKLYKDQLGGLIGIEDSLDEKKLTAAETEKKEKLAKKNKPALKSMQKQYGEKKGKDVYYGWVTNKAKKEA